MICSMCWEAPGVVLMEAEDDAGRLMIRKRLCLECAANVEAALRLTWREVGGAPPAA